MGYDEIARLRNLFLRDTDGLLNHTQRLILIIVLSYDNPTDSRGCFVPHEDLIAINLLKARAWLENMHHLADGSKWESNKRIPCSHPNCLNKETHLGIIRKTGRAYKGKAQGYKVDLDRYEYLLSMRHGAPLESLNELESTHLDTVKGAPISTIGSATAHPYKQHKQDKQLLQETHVEEKEVVVLGVKKLNNFLDKKLELHKRFRADKEIVQLLTALRAKGVLWITVEKALEAVGAPTINNPQGYVRKKLQTLLEVSPQGQSFTPSQSLDQALTNTDRVTPEQIQELRDLEKLDIEKLLDTKSHWNPPA
jgi:hypothetical protein